LSDIKNLEIHLFFSTFIADNNFFINIRIIC